VTALLAAVAVLAFYAFFYRGAVARWGPIMRWALRGLRLGARHPVREVDAIGKLLAAGVAQLLFGLALAWAVGVGLGEIVGPGLRPEIVLAAVALGGGEFALTSLICTFVVVAATHASRGDADAGARTWTASSRGGWISYFLLTVRAAPPVLAAAIIFLYVAVEEVIFRGILMQTFDVYGAVFAVSASAALFVVVQAFSMPNVRAAIFPMVGASVVGVVHGILYVHVPDVVPLAIAHCAFFVAALSTARRPAPITA
jgi:hypothetical protein